MPLPGVLFNALPKSASSYITDMLVRGLGAKRTFLSVGVFPGDLLVFEKLQSFAHGGQVSQQHVPASPENLAYLRKFQLPLIVHARDPRAVIVSWTHHLNAAEGKLDELFWYYPSMCPPAQFLERPFEWQLSWCLENHFQRFVDWLVQWCAAADAGECAPLFTTFEQFIADRGAFFNALLAQAGIAPAAFADPALAPGPQHLFRSGSIDGWRTKMDASAAREATARMPAGLWKRFGWMP